MAYTGVGETELAAFIPEVWLGNALEQLRSQIVLARTVTKDSDMGVFNIGDIVHVPFVGTMTRNAKAADTEVTKQVPSNPVDTTLTLNKYYEATFMVEDVAKAMALPSHMNALVEAAVVPIVEGVETDLFALYSDATNNAGSAAAMSGSLLRTVWAQLNTLKCPVGNRKIIMTSAGMNLLKAESGYQSYFAFADPAVVARGAVASLEGFDVYWSQNVPLSTDYKCLAYDPGAIMMAMRGLPNPPQGSGWQGMNMTDPVSGLTLSMVWGYNGEALGMQVTIRALYGVKIIRQSKLVLVKTTS